MTRTRPLLEHDATVCSYMPQCDRMVVKISKDPLPSDCWKTFRNVILGGEASCCAWDQSDSNDRS